MSHGSDLERPAAEDWYVEAARLVRTEFHGDSPRKFQTEQRVVSRASPRRLRNVILWLLPGLALLGGSVAWAAGGPQLARWMRALGELTQGSAAKVKNTEADKPQHVARERVQSVAAANIASAAPAVLPSSASLTAQLAQPPVRPLEAVAAKVSKSEAPGPPAQALLVPASADDDLALYRAAHAAHFVRADWSAALVAWDRYLERPGVGRFLPEARFNRALALTRLGRAAEAREALRPFVGGVYGTYRQDEAQRLLRQLESSD